MEPRILDVMANRLRHRVLEWDGGGKTVLCLHGFLDLSWGWAPVAERLAAGGLRVLAPDLRGHGDSDRVGPGGYYHFPDYVFDLAELVDALGVKAIAGHSLGGAITSWYAGAFPDAVERIAILEGMSVREESVDRAPGRTAEWVATVRKARARQPRRYASLDEAAARIRQVDPRCPEALARTLAAHGTVAVDDAQGGLRFKHDPVLVTRSPLPFLLPLAEAFWRAVRCPVLIVDGAESEMLAGAPDHIARLGLFPSARRVSIAGAGHMMIRHRPDEVARELLEFFGT